MRFINLGFNNMILDERIVAIVSPESAPAKRTVAEAKESGRIIDCTGGRKTKCVIITDSDHVILSAIQAETITNRLASDVSDDSDDEAEEE